MTERIRIKKSVVDAASPLPATDLFLRDSELKGFGLRVTPKGTKSYFVEYRMGGRGAPKGRVVIGKHGSPWTADTARAKAADVLRKVQDGVNPAVEKRQRTMVAVDLAFQRYADLFIDVYAKKHQKRSWKQAEKTLANNITPKLKDRPLPEITRREIKGLLEDIASTRPATARYAHATLRKLFRWAVDRDDIERSPIVDMPAPAVIASRDRILSEGELAATWHEAGEAYPFGPFVRLLIATGQRRTEIIAMDFSELDMAKRSWVIPGARSKNGVAHVVPLNEASIAILEGLGAKTRKRGLVFTTTGKTPVSGISKFKRALDGKIIERLRKAAEKAGLAPAEVRLTAWRLHDIRRTVASGLQRLGVRFEVTEAVLNHISGSKSGISGVYQRYSWDGEKRAALEAWSRYLDQMLAQEPSGAGNVVPFNAAKA